MEDPVTFKHAIESDKNEHLMAAMESELESLSKIGVWRLVKLPQNSKPIGCKWVYKTKRNLQGKIDRYKARLVRKGYTQQEWVDYNETFSPVSTKDSFRAIMALVAHFQLHLYQMDVKIFKWKFGSRDLHEVVGWFCLKRERGSSVQTTEIHLWFKTSLEAVVFKI
ncbi:unnamed protein product [Prunus armeniaca]